MRHLRSALMAFLLLAWLTSIVHAGTRAGFDSTGRLLLQGVPRFALGVYDSGGSYSSDPALWEQQLFAPTGSRALQGFPLNLYLNYWLGNMPIGPTNALLDVLKNHGMMYLQTGNCFDAGSWTRYGPASFSIMSQAYVQQFAQHPAAAGYYIMDECADALIAETEQHRQQLLAWDPQGITLATTLAAGYRDPALWTSAADVLATDPYPLYGAEPAAGYTHFIVADFVSKLRAVAKPNRPVWSVLQFFKFTTNSRMPTPEEMRAHAVMSIVEGAKGIFWWDIGTNGLRRLDAATVSAYMGHLKALTTELARLEPALVAPASPGALVGNSTAFADPVAGRITQLQHNIAIEWLFSRKQWYQAELAALQAGDRSKSGGLLDGAANVRTLTKVVDGIGYVFAYNYTNVVQPVKFTWQGMLANVTESRDGRSLPVSGATWSDTFGPYQSRIYVVTPRATLSVQLTNPASGASVSGTATVTMAATGGSGTGYAYHTAVDGVKVYAGTNPTFSWNTTATAPGPRSLTATVSDSAGATATTTQTVNVLNALPSFLAALTYPASGATVRGSQTVGMSTTAAWGQPKTFTLSVDGTVLSTQSVTGTTVWYQWDTKSTANGARTLTVAVTMNNQTATAKLPVTVSNTPASAPTATFTASFSYPAASAKVSGGQTVGMATTAAWGQSKTFTLSVDGKVVTTQTLTGTTLWYTWDTRTVPNGAHTLTLGVTFNGRTATATLPMTVNNR
jgi:hypothetical protein